MKANPWFLFSMIILTFMGGCTFIVFNSLSGVVQTPTQQIAEDSILLLELEGVILDGKKFLKEIRDYSEKDNIKGVVVRVNSPGGVVGPSQEIYSEIMRVRDIVQKPIYISANGLMASGAFYAAMGASKIYANKGSLLGSIGVIMNFANLEELYSWAKIKRFNLTTGRFKDTGSDFRSMREDEKTYLNALLSESLNQFIDDIVTGRKIQRDKVAAVADGRVFTGVFAKQYGFIDEIGGLHDAISAIGEATGLGKNPKVYRPQKTPEEFFEMLGERVQALNPYSTVKDTLHLQNFGKPMFILPQYAE